MSKNKFNKLAKVSKSRKMGKIDVDVNEDVFSTTNPLDKYPFQKKFSVEQSFRNMYETADLNLSEDDDGGRTDGQTKSPSEMTPKQRQAKADHDKAKKDRDASKAKRVAQMQKDKAHADTPAEKARKQKERDDNLKKFGGQGKETFRQRMARTGGTQTNSFDPTQTEETHPCKGLSEDDPCWDNYKQVGMKKKNGKEVPNCVPESNQFNTYRNMIDMWTEETQDSLQEAMLTYRVKKMQKPEIAKFNQSAKLMKLKITFNHGKDDSLIVMSGNKKQLRDFDGVARGKSSYGDASLAVKHFDER